MRINIGVSETLQKWYGDLGVLSVQASLDLLRVAVLLGENAESRKDLLRQARDFDTEFSKLFIESFLCELPWVDSKPSNRSDFVVKDSAGSRLTDFDYVDLRRTRLMPVKIGDSREYSFQRLVAPLLVNASRVTLIDPYFHSAMLGNKERRWLFSRIIQMTSARVEVLTDFEGDDNVEATFPRVARTIASLAKATGSRAVIDLRLYSSVLHHRRLICHFDRNSVAMHLEKGIDTWSRDPFGEGSDPYIDESSDDAKSRVTHIKKKSRLIADATLNRI